MSAPLLLPHHGVTPVVPSSAYVAATAVLVGDVVLGEESSVWFQVVIRGDINPIRIGDRTNIQDGTVVHVVRDRHPTLVGDDVVVGHLAMLHGCTVGHRCLVGMASVLLDGCEIGEESIVAAGALVPPGMRAAPRSLLMGRPARSVRTVRDDEVEKLILGGVRNYLEYKETYRTPPAPGRAG